MRILGVVTEEELQLRDLAAKEKVIGNLLNDLIKKAISASSTLHHPFGMMADLIDTKDERGASLYRWCVKEV
jgi:hypothetical protein